MFFRREKIHVPTFDERLSVLKDKYGFAIEREKPTLAKVTRAGCGAMIDDLGAGQVKIGKAGVVINGEIALLINGGYQMFFATPSGQEIAAQAKHLEVLHAFEEDLREGLGMTVLYNLALGTVSDEHLYDRVEARDRGPQHRPWDK